MITLQETPMHIDATPRRLVKPALCLLIDIAYPLEISSILQPIPVVEEILTDYEVGQMLGGN